MNPLAPAAASAEEIGDLKASLKAAVADVCGLKGPFTASADSGLNAKVLQLYGVGATPDEVRARAARYPSEFSNAGRITPFALEKWWPRLGPPVAASRSSPAMSEAEAAARKAIVQGRPRELAIIDFEETLEEIFVPTAICLYDAMTENDTTESVSA